jgi:predicted metal-binding protein
MNFNQIQTTPKEFVFTLKARDMCRSCKRYGTKASCPPRVESLEYYSAAIKEYKNAIIFYKEYTISDFSDFAEAGKESSLELQQELIAFRNNLLKQGQLFVTCFGGGSCKLCDTCSIVCRFPDKSTVPLEAAGVDVFATLKPLGIELPRIIKDRFYRVGAVFYD